MWILILKKKKLIPPGKASYKRSDHTLALYITRARASNLHTEMSVFRIQLLPSPIEHCPSHFGCRYMVRQIGRSDLPNVTVSVVVHGTAHTILCQDSECKKPAFAVHGTVVPKAQFDIRTNGTRIGWSRGVKILKELYSKCLAFVVQFLILNVYHGPGNCIKFQLLIDPNVIHLARPYSTYREVQLS